MKVFFLNSLFRYNTNRKTFQQILSYSFYVTFLCILFVACSDDHRDDLTNQTLFEKHFGTGQFLVSGFVEKSAGGFYGTGSSFSDGLTKPFVVSFDHNGDTLWTWKENLNVPSSNHGVAIAETSDGGCIVLLKTSLLLLDANGSFIKGISMAAPYQSVVGQIVQAHDGGYVINFANYSTDGPLVHGTSKLMKFNGSLELLWSKEYTDRHRDLIRASDNSYALARWVNDYSFRIMDIDGSETNSLTYGDTDQESLVSLSQKSNGGFLLAGYFRWGEYSHTYIMSTDWQGNIVWEKEYYNGVTDNPLGIIELNGNDIVFIKRGAEGSRDSNTWPGVYKIFSNYKIYLVRTNSNGDVVFQTELNVDDPDSNNADACLLKTRNGYAILAAINNELVIKEFHD